MGCYRPSSALRVGLSKAGLSEGLSLEQLAVSLLASFPTRCLSFTSCCSAFRLSECNKENFRNCVPQKGSLRAEEQQRPGSGSEGNSKGSHWKADGQRHAFDYVELSPLPQDPGNQGSLQRTKGSLRISDRTPKYEELERDLAIRSEERRKWFESPDGRVPNSDGPAGDSSRKAGEQDLPAPPLSEDQRIRLNEEIEKKWLELERLPLKDLQRVPLTALLNQSKAGQGDTSEALKKEVRASLLSEIGFWWPLNVVLGSRRLCRRARQRCREVLVPSDSSSAWKLLQPGNARLEASSHTPAEVP